MAKAPLSVEEALQTVLRDAKALDQETVPLSQALGRVLAQPLAARLTQPPFDASAMDGYAVRAADLATLPTSLEVIGEAAAGHPFDGALASGQAVRIFTGAPLPAGADSIVIQENTRREGARVEVLDGTPDPSHVRPRGGDFLANEERLAAGTPISPTHLALAAAMGHASLPVVRRPAVAVLATGDELVEPGMTPGPGQIVASNSYAIAAMVERAGGEAKLLGIAADTMDSLAEHLDRAKAADILVTIGGASVGDHDLVSKALSRAGFELDFWKIAMRPGKPLMLAHKPTQRAIGVPGNPVSSIICTAVFVAPLVATLAGRNPTNAPGQMTATLTHDLPANGPRQHYMRARLEASRDGAEQHVTAAANQDSSLLSVLAESNALIVRPPNAPPAPEGSKVTVQRIDF